MKRGLVLVFFIVLSGIILSISYAQHKEKSIVIEKNNDRNKGASTIEEWSNPLSSVKMKDNKELYKEDVDGNIDEIYITILPPTSKEYVTFQDLNNYVEIDTDYVSDGDDPVALVAFENYTNGFSSENMTPNATMELRGQSSRKAPQKSYKIKLYDDTELWFGLKTINLNKHFKDSLRIRNKLSFDYFELLPDFISLRTRFVKVYFKDLSSKVPDETFSYYGLYTVIEQPNKRFLKRHNLDSNGYLYKAEFFEFYRYKEYIKAKEDITYDPEKIEEILEVSTNDNHHKLIKMLEEVNDYSRSINDIIDEYFDRDNLLTWVAVNILFDNYDTTSRNFLLYSAINSDKWFFIPWDYDKAWRGTSYRNKWQRSLSNYWGMVLFNRFFRDPRNVDALSNKIEELTLIINQKNTLSLISKYYENVKESIFVSPDIDYLKYTENEYDNDYFSLPEFTEKNRQYYYLSLENPMPFFQGEPIQEGNTHIFHWGASYDLQGDNLKYEFVLSKDYKFEDIVVKYENLSETSCEVDNIKSGQYFWTVIVYDSKGNWQEAFDYYLNEINELYSCKEYIVK